MKCIFCERDRKSSREHLWPRWAQETFEPEERAKRVPYSIEPHNQPPVTWDAPAFTATLKDVCRECNGGWMSGIESEAKSFMEPLIKGEEGHLIDLNAQWAIARWTYLKVLLFERVDNRQRLFPESRCRQMYECCTEDEPSLPADMSVFITAHEGERIGQYQHRLLADAETERPELFIGTITLRQLVVQAIVDIAEDGEPKAFQHDKRITGHEERIWPFSEPFEWPPGLALSDSGLEVFGGPQPGNVTPVSGGFLRRLFWRGH